MPDENTQSKHIPRRVHVVGICGVATSALAVAFHECGVVVTGSDKGFFPPVSTELEKRKVPFYAGWHPEKMIERGVPEVVIVGTASGSQNPETLYAKEHNIPIYSFAEAIGRFFSKKNSIVATGTWGKTSSSALISHIFNKADLDPTYMFGGVSLSHEGSARLTESDWSIFEGDEYKSSPTDKTAKFFYYKPTRLLLSAVSWDHADLYPTEQSYFDTFKKLIGQIPKDGLIVYCNDQSGAVKIAEYWNGKKVSYGREGSGSAYMYKSIEQTKDGLRFSIAHEDKEYKIYSPMLGAYQAENITGCFAMAHQSDISPDDIISGIADFQGLKRRLEKRLDSNDNDEHRDSEHRITVIDDIAHSPEKARSVLATLKNIYSGKITVVFEPNIGGRKREAILKYKDAFKDADSVIIPRLTKLKIIAEQSTVNQPVANDSPIEGDELASAISETHDDVKYIDDDAKLVDYIVSNAQTVSNAKIISTIKTGDVIAFLGSHGFRGMIESVVEKLGKK